MNYQIKKYNSPNFDARKNNAEACIIVIHCTETKTLKEAHEIYMNEKIIDGLGQISAHYVIDKDGSIFQYIDEKKRAWHAGKSYWDKCRDVNSYSIGIEMVNEGKINNYPEYPIEQLDALIWLCNDIKTRYKIPKSYILGHSDISPYRKTDPDKHFNWKYLSEQGIGLFPEINEEEFKMAENIRHDLLGIKGTLVTIGYDPELDPVTLIQAFNRRYAGHNNEDLDAPTCTILMELLNIKNKSAKP